MYTQDHPQKPHSYQPGTILSRPGQHSRVYPGMEQAGKLPSAIVSKSPFKLVTVADTGITSELLSLLEAESVDLLSELFPQPTATVATIATHKSALMIFFSFVSSLGLLLFLCIIHYMLTLYFSCHILSTIHKYEHYYIKLTFHLSIKILNKRDSKY